MPNRSDTLLDARPRIRREASEMVNETCLGETAVSRESEAGGLFNSC